MTLHNTFEDDILKLFLNATAIANLADNAASSPFTNIYVSLHTADPGETGDQTTSETAYTNYARIAVARTTGGWSVSSGVASNVAAVTFAQCGVTGATITYASLGTASSGAGKRLVSGALTSSIAVSNGITPSFAIGAITFTMD